MRDTNKLTAYAKQMAHKAKENLLHKLMRREVNVGGNGTQSYVLKLSLIHISEPTRPY